ncbi:MAG: amino acid ABC transporter substrate-binding protein [Pseudomonadota bacterium]|jgi:general L-amino acid transport system substrate-binding protein|uniref:amino acid ABC transporter substrate-binding protein n=1 Tax=Salinicola TaxID=404432 RepID=UPI000B3F908A|nr:amino acid ABC transporter substrate-binding protein [Salinicola salarius]MED5500324.1 amino acid ABC transporter substrate-binding protein [Pseudomonadota bacterium]
MRHKNKSLSLLSIAALGTLAVTQVQAATLDDVKSNGTLRCGVNAGLTGFSAPDQDGHWTGIDADFCRAMAAATLGKSESVAFTPLTAKERFTALQSGEVDVLSRNTTWTAMRDNALGLNFTGVTFYDGQAFMVSKDLGVSSLKELNGATICIQSGTTHELNIADYFPANNLDYQLVTFDTPDQTAQGFDSGRCDVLTSDSSQLAALRLQLKDPDSVTILPERISKEPLGPVVRQGDDQWFDIAKWTLFAMLNAEELGVTSDNVDEMRDNPPNPGVARLLGKDGKYGEQLGLDNAWAYNIVKQVGNYGEIYARNVGADSPLKIDRGINALWNDGGIQYAPPVR